MVALVVGASAAVTLALTGSSPNASILGYVPGDSLAYAEVRLDLPGDQRQQVAAFLSKFPGFADQAALDTKIGETLDQLVGKASDGKQSYTKDIAPWFGGELGYRDGAALSPGAGLHRGRADGRRPGCPGRGLALRRPAVGEGRGARPGLVRPARGRPRVRRPRPQTYGSTKLTVYADAETKVDLAFGIVDGKVALLGDLTSVKAAIDTKGAGRTRVRPGIPSGAGGECRRPGRVLLRPSQGAGRPGEGHGAESRS